MFCKLYTVYSNNGELLFCNNKRGIYVLNCAKVLRANYTIVVHITLSTAISSSKERVLTSQKQMIIFLSNYQCFGSIVNANSDR